MAIKLVFVIPCYNEKEVLSSSLDILLSKLNTFQEKNLITKDSFLLCVDDGSKDTTWYVIEQYSKSHAVKGIKLTTNEGHQIALLAGLQYALQYNPDSVITLDADLQDDVEAIESMIMQRIAGDEIVYGVRINRKRDSLFKRKSANLFYDIMNKSESNIIPNHSDFRLMSKGAIINLLQYDERNLFLRGIIPTMGLKSSYVYYDRRERLAGNSKYPLMKMLSFAIEGITSFSVRPIRMIFILGIFFLLITLSVLVYVVVSILLGRNIPGWASLMLSLWFIGSLILIALGVIGEYVSKIYLEVKHRPRYFIEDETDKN